MEPIQIGEFGEEPLSEEQNIAINSYPRISTNLIGSWKDRNIYVSNKILHNNGNNVGIIETKEGIRFEFKPKFDVKNQRKMFWEFLPVMLNSLFNLRDFNKKIFIDTNRKIDLPYGFNYVPFLALSYISLFEKVRRIGLLKKYVKKNEYLKSLKGKIDFTKLFKKQSWNLTNVPCSYYDLTFDNFVNKFILWGAYRLIRKFSDSTNTSSILTKLREQFQFLSQEIELIPFHRHHIPNILQLNYPVYYLDLINLCTAILNETLFELKVNKKSSSGLNFIIDMDWIFEQYMTKIFKDVCKDLKYEDLVIYEQISNRYLGDRKNITIRPDLVIKKNNKTLSIIDFKWKSIEKNYNSDFYQVICYALAELNKNDLNNIPANLFCVDDTTKKFDSGKISKNEIDVISDIFGNKKNVQIFKLAIPQNVFELDNKEIEINIKNIISDYLKNIMENT